MSQQTIEQLISSQQLRWGQTSTSSTGKTWVYADSVVVEDYRHLGKLGSLSLDFFEKKLYVASFFPKDYKIYRPILSKQLKVVSPKRLIVQRGNTRIEEGEGFGKRGELGRHIAWIDLQYAELANEAFKRDD